LNWIFKDLKTDNKYYNFIEELSTKWFIYGYADGTFKPNAFITRVEFLKLLFLINSISIIEYDYETFIDLKKWSWQKKYIDTALELWIITKNTKFFPNYNLNLSQAIKMVIKLIYWEIDNNYNWIYLDVSKTDWYAKYVQFIYNNKLLTISWKFFYPNRNITRIQVIELLYNLLNMKKFLDI